MERIDNQGHQDAELHDGPPGEWLEYASLFYKGTLGVPGWPSIACRGGDAHIIAPVALDKLELLHAETRKRVPVQFSAIERGRLVFGLDNLLLSL